MIMSWNFGKRMIAVLLVGRVAAVDMLAAAVLDPCHRSVLNEVGREDDDPWDFWYATARELGRANGGVGRSVTGRRLAVGYSEKSGASR
jgi:hypothetical protein